MFMSEYKHNKKRNTGFLYTILIQELTKSILDQDKQREKLIKTIIFESFKKGSELKKESNIFKQFENIEEFSKEQIQSLINMAKIEYNSLNKRRLDEEKSHLIYTINRKIGQDVYNNFVPNYRLLATVDQIFSDKVSIKSKIMLEAKLIDDIENNREKLVTLPSIDNITFKTFVEKFNDKYSNLLSEQKELLFNYILSLEQNNLGFKFYLNEEIFRMKKVLNDSVRNDKNFEIVDNKDKIIQKLDEFRMVEISQEMLTNILKIQELVNTLCQSK